MSKNIIAKLQPYTKITLFKHLNCISLLQKKSIKNNAVRNGYEGLKFN